MGCLTAKFTPPIPSRGYTKVAKWLFTILTSQIGTGYISLVARVPWDRGQKYFCAPTNKNCKVWSEICAKRERSKRRKSAI